MRKVRKFVVMIALLVLWGNRAHAENDNLSFQMEIVIEDRLVPFTPVPIEVVITNVSGKALHLHQRVKRAGVRNFNLTILDEEGESVYSGVASTPHTYRAGSTFYGPPFAFDPMEELSLDLRLKIRGRNQLTTPRRGDGKEVKPQPLFPDTGMYQLVFEYDILFYDEADEDAVERRETLRSEVSVDVGVEPEHEEAFRAVRRLNLYSRVALVSLSYATSFIPSDLIALQRREGVFPDEEAMEEARVERRKDMHAELAEFLADHGDSPWAPYAWAVEARNTFIEHEDRVLAAEKALAAAEKYNVSHIREDMEDLLEKAREYERRREFAELFWFLGPLKIRADGSGQVMRLRPPREYFRPGGRPILRRHGIVHDVDNISEYMEEEADLRDVALLVEFEEGAFAEQATFQIGEEEKQLPAQLTLVMGDPDGGFIRASIPQEISGYRDVMAFLTEAPEKGYKNKLIVDTSDLVDSEISEMYFYFRSDGRYGKGGFNIASHIRSDQENLNWVSHTFTFHINPTEGDRNVKHVWHWDDESE